MNKTRLAQTLSLLIASTTFSTAPALELDGEFSLGFMNFDIDHSNTVVGQYSGVHDDDRRFLAEFDLSARLEENYLYLNGSNLGLDSRQLGVEWGRYGLFGLSFEHSQIDTFTGVNALTPYDGVGSDELTLPSGFVKGTTVTDMSTLADDLKRVDLATERASNRLEFSLTPNENFRINLAFFREERQGTQSLGAAIGIPGRFDNYPSIVLPAPVDQVTNNIEAALSYHNAMLQWELNYQWSQFNNRDTALTWDNPYNGQSYYPDQALTSLDPDNSYHNLGLSGALNFTPSTRLVISANLGRMTQDSAMLDYTINSSSTISDPLTQTSAQAEKDTRRLQLKLTSKPLRRLSLNLGYNYDKTSNNTPVDMFQRVVNDAGDQQAIDSSRANYNPIHEYSRSRLKLDGGYYFGKGTSLKLAVSQENVDRSHRAVENTQERSLSAKLNSRFSPQATFSVGLQQDRRRADDDYDHSLVYQAFHSSDYIATVTANEQFDNNPALRQFDIANRDRNNLNLSLNLYPHPDVVVGIYHSLNRENYTEELLGLDDLDQQVTTLDLSYTPSEDVTLFGYLTHEQVDFAIDGRNFSSAGPPGTKYNSANDPDNDWTVDNHDAIDTIGAGTRFSLLQEDLIISIKAFYSREQNRLNITTGANLSAKQVPEDEAKRKGIEIEGDYYVNSQFDIRLGLAYEEFQDSQWARDVIPPSSTASDELITLMVAEPDYTAYVAYTALRFKW